MTIEVKLDRDGNLDLPWVEGYAANYYVYPADNPVYRVETKTAPLPRGDLDDHVRELYATREQCKAEFPNATGFTLVEIGRYDLARTVLLYVTPLTDTEKQDWRRTHAAQAQQVDALCQVREILKKHPELKSELRSML